MLRRPPVPNIERDVSAPWWTSESDALLDGADADLTALRFFDATSEEEPNDPGEMPIDEDDWLNESSRNGFVRVFDADLPRSRLVRCKTSTTSLQLTRDARFGASALVASRLYVQTNGFTTRRVDDDEFPLQIQNRHLESLGFDDVTRIQDEGRRDDLVHFVRFIIGTKIPKASSGGGGSRLEFSGTVDIKDVSVFSRWRRRFCLLSGTKLLIFPAAAATSFNNEHLLNGVGKPRIFHLAGGVVSEYRQRQQCLILTSKIQANKSILMACRSWQEYSKWIRRCQTAVSLLPNEADLSCCSLERIPEYLFLNPELGVLNLCCNFMRRRSKLEKAETIGWIDDLVKFSHLQSLLLADNNLHALPLCLFDITSLTELNVSKNRLRELPEEIGKLTNLQTLQVHTNCLGSLPSNVGNLRHLTSLIVSFNEMTEIPQSVFELKKLQNLIATGNKIAFISDEVKQLRSLQHFDLRMNCLLSIPIDILMHIRPLVSLDVRENHLHSIDISKMTTLQEILCAKNALRVLVLRGGEMTNVVARSNLLISLQFPQLPQNLVHLDVSRNSLTVLPDALCDLQKLETIDASYNELAALPARIFWNMKRLHALYVDHNKLASLPERIDNCQISVLTVHYNRISYLPASMLMRLYRLRHLNVSTNVLVSIPILGPTDDLNNVEELFLSGNMLRESAMLVAARYKKLRVLHIAFNKIKNISAKSLGSLTVLEELNVAGNDLSSLPNCFDRLSLLSTLVVHTNDLVTLPDFSLAKSLSYLDAANNDLKGIPNAMKSFARLKYVDLSYNPDLLFDYGLLEAIKGVRRAVLEGTSFGRHEAMSESFPELTSYGGNSSTHGKWTHGSAEYKSRKQNTKLASIQVKLGDFRAGHGALYAIFDGGSSLDVPRKLIKTFRLVLVEELERQTPRDDPSKYMQYAFLSAHKLLGSVGRRKGASAVVCHVRRVPGVDGLSDGYFLTVGNVGHAEAVLCREGRVHVLTTKHTIDSNEEERRRLRKIDTFLSEDNRVNGVSTATRLLGCSYLSPSVIPAPFVRTVALTPDDEFVVIGCAGLWTHVTYNQAVTESRRIKNPSAAAKRLRDLARAYGSTSSISVVVVRFSLAGIAVAKIDEKYDVPLSPPRRGRYRWSTIEEFVRQSSLNSAASSQAGSLRSIRSGRSAIGKRFVAASGSGADPTLRTLASQTEEEIAADTTTRASSSIAALDDDDDDELVVEHNYVVNPFLLDASLAAADSSNPFVTSALSGAGLTFVDSEPPTDTSVVDDLDEAMKGIARGLASQMDRVHRWALDENEGNVTGSTLLDESSRNWKESQSTVHIPELDDLDKTLSLIDQDLVENESN